MAVLDDKLRDAMTTFPFWEHVISSEMDRIVPKPPTEIAACRKTALRLLWTNTIRAILDKSESPIESILLSNLAFFMWHRRPLALVHAEFLPHLKDYRGAYLRATALQAETALTLSEALQTEVGEADVGSVLLNHLIYDDFSGMTAVHMFSQWSPDNYPTEIGVLGLRDYALRELSGLRIDIVFTDVQMTRRIAVECDGYRWHKNNFETDRQRDRLLRRIGFDVLRFAGTEIYHHPIETAAELEKYLFQVFPEAKE